MSQHILLTGADRAPLYSLRTLCRALLYCRRLSPTYGARQALYEGLYMSFCTSLHEESRAVLDAVLRAKLGVSAQQLNQRAKRPGHDFIAVQGFWVPTGSVAPEEHLRDVEEKERSGKGAYVVTATVGRRLKDLARIVVSGNPVLLQGPTSAGKTSLVMYLAKMTGHRCVRINNHEHTDLQEYMGSYVSDAKTGKLVFQDGALVEAVKKGYWVVLDELNLAPSEVLEALNRLLDDNRELFIPETQETVVPHPDFLLFATQNPPSVYGGRKVLSRAFQNRFVTLHCDDIPEQELVAILEKQCGMPKSRCEIMVNVMKELQKIRQTTGLFAGKKSFLTPRDLFRWGNRQPNSLEDLATQGYMLLAERLRDDNAKKTVQTAIEKYVYGTKPTAKKIDVIALYSPERVIQSLKLLSRHFRGEEEEKKMNTTTAAAVPEITSLDDHVFDGLSWTPTLRRLFVLVEAAVRFKEPVLLVGETGCGKTTVCQVFARVLRRELHIINCHQTTETADFLGGLRPIRTKMHVEEDVLKELTGFQETWNALCNELQRQDALLTWDEAVGVEERKETFKQVSLAVLKEILVRKQGAVDGAEDQEEEEAEGKEVDAGTTIKSVLKIAGNAALKQLHASSVRVKGHLARLDALFEWVDGALVRAMRDGELLLVDEISLGEDAVIERLNSVLEPSRTLFLAEKAGDVTDALTAEEHFRLFATMNPGGDFGKKELSPALRNRFTEIWVPPLNEQDEFAMIIEQRMEREELRPLAMKLLEFLRWFRVATKGQRCRITVFRSSADIGSTTTRVKRDLSKFAFSPCTRSKGVLVVANSWNRG